MKKLKLILGLFIIFGLAMFNVSTENKSAKLNFSIQSLFNNANALCEYPYNQLQWSVTKNCDETPPTINCSSGGRETCCLADHCPR